jgi:hypothetical protein
MTMSAYRKFSDALREIEVREAAAPKPPKLPNDAGFEVEAERTLDALGGLGGLGGGELEPRNTPGLETTTQPAIKEDCPIEKGDFANSVHGHLNHLKPQPSCGAKGERAAAVERDCGTIRRKATSSMGPALVAPAPWFERSASPASGEPPFDKPCVPRRGRVERQGRLFLHFCVECGAWGAFGYGVTKDRPGRWYCREHRPNHEV